MSAAITNLKHISPSVRMEMLDTINRLHYLAEVLTDKDAAVAFNREASGPMKKLQHKFDMPCGNTIRVPRKI